MISTKDLFYRHVAQTSEEPLALEIVKAEGIYLYDKDGKSYMDMISGVSVSNIGHCHPKVVEAVTEQCQQYMHLMVYGEYIVSPQVMLAHRLTDLLPKNLDAVYFVNSGSEATEGAIKLAKRFTGRSEIISCQNAYHGCTNGSMSIMGNDDFTRPFRPLLPATKRIRFGNLEDLSLITTQTAVLIIEPVQGEAGIRFADNAYWKALRKKCDQTGTLLAFDEIQTGFGRTGTLFAFEQLEIVPDILMLAKAMGGGMPIGAFVASKKIMNCLTNNPVLGHITTFGGHAVCCAAALASLNVIEDEKLYTYVERKGQLFEKLLKNNSRIKEFRRKGLMMALDFKDRDFNFACVKSCVQKGIITDWFLFCDTALRIAPPLTVTEEEIEKAAQLINEAIEV